MAGLMCQKQERLEKALAEYDEAIRLYPEFAEAYAARAMVYTLLGKKVEAEQDIEQAVELGYPSDRLKEEIEELEKTR